MNFFEHIRNDINLLKVKPLLTRLTAEEEYFKGDWDQTSFFIKDLVNLNLALSDDYFIELADKLKSIGVVGASFNRYSAGTCVMEHTDSELIGLNSIKRFFIPLESHYRFEYSGTCLHENVIQKVSNITFNDDVLFIPQKLHSYKNLDEFDQYFIIADLSDSIENIPKDFWDNYFKVAVQYYI